MGLTDPLTLATACAVTAVLYVAAVALTPRLTARLWGALARALLIAACSLGVLASVGMWQNDANGWYVSWSDLLGTDADPASTGAQGSPAGVAAADTGAAPAAPHVTAPLPQPGRRLQTYEVTGTRSELRMQVLVYLPASYESSPQRSYPVVEALHGYPGTPAGWTGTMDVGAQIDAAVASHAIAESIVVVPQINQPLSRDGECVNGPAGTPQLETWVTSDVPQFVRTHLRARTDRSAWAVMGYSEGGYCAAMAGVLHPQTYGAAVVLSGYFTPQFDGSAPVLPPGSARARRYDLVAAVATAPPTVALWVQAGRLSEYWPQTRAFVQAVRPPTSVTTSVQGNAGHRWDVWKAQVPVALSWLGHEIPGFRPA